ncbi:MAG: ATP-binding cassette domain-containing protein [Candidatus Aramenus sp.]|nr:ATP-binding cassette domain-containing protein [Candidatus Aramenus sp.]
MLEYSCVTTDRLRCFSLKLSKGARVGVLGQRDSGKEDAINVALGLKKAVSGDVLLDGQSVLSLSEVEMNEVRWARISAVFYDPYATFNPIYDVASHFAEIVVSHGLGDYHVAVELAKEFLRILGGKEELLYKYPSDLTPLEAKKVSIAMASFLEPDYILLDDIEYKLNDNGRASILNALINLMGTISSGFLILDNDPAVLSRLSNYFLVVYRGEVVEEGEEVVFQPYHPYTMDLLSGNLGERNLDGKGCRYSENCKFSSFKCKEREPKFTSVGKSNVKCFMYPW